MTDRLMTTEEAATMLQLTEATLKKWRLSQYGPRYIRVGKRQVRYRWSDLMEWIDDQANDTEQVRSQA